MAQQPPEIDQLFLKDIPQESKIYLGEGMSLTDGSSFVMFHHRDGMYSYCTTSVTRLPIHLSLFTPLREYEDGYQIMVPVKEE